MQKAILSVELCFAFFFLCKFITYFSVNKIPSYGEANFYTADLMYYIGNSIEMVKEFPTKDFRWYTQPYKYNLFGSAQMALVQMVMRIPMTVLEFSYGFIQPCILLVFSMYTLFKRLGLQIKFCALGLVSAFLASGWESGTFCTYAAHIYIVSFGFDISLAYMMLSILFYILYIQEKRINGKILILLLLFLMACTGSKAPIAVVLMAAFGIECAYRFIIKHSYKSTPVVGLCMLSTFLLIFFGITSNGFNTLNGNGNSLTLQPLRNVMNSRVGSSIISFLPSALPLSVKCLIAVIIYIALSVPGLGILSVMILKCRKIINRDVLERNLIFLNVIIVGIIFGFITDQNGYSQMYFILAVIPSVTVLLMKVLSEIYIRRNRCAVAVVTIIIVMLGIFQVYQYKHYYKTGVINLVRGIDNVWSENQVNLVTYEEYEAYEWIRDNTDEASLLASNVILQTNQGRSFVTGAFSERHLWLEGWEYGYVVRSEEEVLFQKDLMTRVMENDTKAVEELINDRVDYLIQIKRVSPDFALDMQYGQLVFENDSVCIYSIN